MHLKRATEHLESFGGHMYAAELWRKITLLFKEVEKTIHPDLIPKLRLMQDFRVLQIDRI
jgi:hypothetical protein